MEDELFNLAGQITVLMQTTPCSMEEEWMLTALQEREEHLMSKGEKLWKRIAKVWQGTSAPESNIRLEAAEEVQQSQTLDREGAPFVPSSTPLAMALARVTTGADPTFQQPSLEQNTSISPEYGGLTGKEPPTTPDVPVPAVENPPENEEVEDKGPSQEIWRTEQTVAIQAAPQEWVRLYGRRLG